MSSYDRLKSIHNKLQWIASESDVYPEYIYLDSDERQLLKEYPALTSKDVVLYRQVTGSWTPWYSCICLNKQE
jgi:hypothetical protein